MWHGGLDNLKMNKENERQTTPLPLTFLGQRGSPSLCSGEPGDYKRLT
ncbi:MAG: hypothetical protein RL042_393 [Nitrospirota bacterium]